VETIPLHYHWGCRTFQTASHIHAIHILGVWTPYTVMDGMGIWQHTHTVTTTEVSPDLGEFTEILDDVNVKTIPLPYRWGCRTFQSASHIHVIKVLEHLKQLWMGIWQHNHTVATTEVSPYLGKFSEIIYDVNVEMIPLHYHWGCRTFQTASHIHAIHILCVWIPYTVMDGWGYGSTLTPLPPQRFPQIWESS
jgi:hypothetical protein